MWDSHSYSFQGVYIYIQQKDDTIGSLVVVDPSTLVRNVCWVNESINRYGHGAALVIRGVASFLATSRATTRDENSLYHHHVQILSPADKKTVNKRRFESVRRNSSFIIFLWFLVSIDIFGRKKNSERRCR
jgi:hypothetical protein